MYKKAKKKNEVVRACLLEFCSNYLVCNVYMCVYVCMHVYVQSCWNLLVGTYFASFTKFVYVCVCEFSLFLSHQPPKSLKNSQFLDSHREYQRDLKS